MYACWVVAVNDKTFVNIMNYYPPAKMIALLQAHTHTNLHLVFRLSLVTMQIVHYRWKLLTCSQP
jgi:hypothetical protein